MLCDVQHMTVPTENNATEKTRRVGLPKMFETEARKGMATAVDKRYAVPTHIPCVVVPLRSSTMDYRACQHIGLAKQVWAQRLDDRKGKSLH